MKKTSELIHPVCPSCGSREVIGDGANLEVMAEIIFSSTGNIGLQIDDIVAKSLFFITDFECAECDEYWEDRTNINNILRGVINAD